MYNPNVLVIDDEDIIRTSCHRILTAHGYSVKTAKSGTEGLNALTKEGFDLVLIDLRMPDIDGIEVLCKVKEQWPDTEVIIITGYSTVSSAVQAMKYGAFDYLEKPFTPDNLSLVVSNALERKRLLLESTKPGRETHGLYEVENLVGKSMQMQHVLRSIAAVSPTDTTVLITGESGTGKELVAKAIHYNSMRREQQLVVVDCGTIPDSLIESELFGYIKGAFTGATENKDGLIKLANGGSIFLDEIANINLSTQAKLLRVLQEREFRPIGAKHPLRADIRVIAATNKDLELMVKDGSFREDLFYRLNIFPIKLPPLRERKEDIPALSYYFLKKTEKDKGKNATHISVEAMKILTEYEWPGNIRELENIIARAVILSGSDTLMPSNLPFLAQQPTESVPKTLQELKEIKKDLRSKSIEDIEKSFLLNALKRNNGNITKAALEVGMQRTNFHALLKKYGISTD